MSPSFSVSEPVVAPRDIEVDIAADLNASGGKLMSSFEADELDSLSEAQTFTDVAGASESIAAALGIIPQMEASAKPMGLGGAIKFGGHHLANVARATAAVTRAIAARNSYEANLSAKIGSYARREQEWAFASNAAAAEITQTYKQWRAAQITEAIAEREWHNHQEQIRLAEEIERFLTDEKAGKTSTKALYTWLRREVRALYGQTFSLAVAVARKAERALQAELGDSSLTFLQYGYLSGRQSLLAGEKLQLDLKRMEMAYHELNQREYELTRHVSLRQVDPIALLTLRATGSCSVVLPEELFDLDCPGHYFRRIKSVALSIPCVVGPYASVNCTLTLQKSTIRKSPVLNDNEDPYARDGDDTERFVDSFGRVQSIVTRSGTNDSGMFETNLRDER
jgi:Tc toxin complex TcA C-terminal TcB-binding domain